MIWRNILSKPDTNHCGTSCSLLPLYKIRKMITAILFALLFLLLFGLLFIPIELYLNTNTNQCFLHLKGLVKARFENDEEELLRIRVRFFFKNFHFYPLRKLGAPKRQKLGVKKDKKHQGIKPKRILRLLKSFRIKKLSVNIDTGDYLLNARLYPVFAFLNYHKGNFNINFEGSNKMVLHLQNRPIYIIKSFINI